MLTIVPSHGTNVAISLTKDASQVTAVGGASAVPAGGGSSLLLSGGSGISLPTL